jgi:hypothetical protein
MRGTSVKVHAGEVAEQLDLRRAPQDLAMQEMHVVANQLNLLLREVRSGTSALTTVPDEASAVLNTTIATAFEQLTDTIRDGFDALIAVVASNQPHHPSDD